MSTGGGWLGISRGSHPHLLTPSGGHQTYGRQEAGTHPTGMLSCYFPQMKFAKVMFLHVSVCPQWGVKYLGRYPPGHGTPPRTRYTPWQVPPRPGTPPGTWYTPRTRYTPWQVPPPDQVPPRAGKPPDQVHSPDQVHPQDQVHPWCILVSSYFNFYGSH